jgi:O-antigen/teichoic acid export membrane protein
MKDRNESTYYSDISKITKNAGIATAGEIAVNIFGYITSIVMTRTVGSAIYGIFSIAYIVTWIAQVFSTAGLNQGLLRFVAFYKAKEDIPRLKGTIIFGTKVAFSLSLFFAVLLFLIADIIAVRLFHNKDIEIAIKILIIAIPFLTISDLLLNCIQSFQIIKYQVYIQKVLQPSVRLIFLIMLFLIGLKLTALLISYVISAFIGLILASYYVLKIFPIHKNQHSSVYEKKNLINFSLPLLFSQFLGLMTFYTDSLMLGYFKNDYDVGVYSAVFRVALLVIIPLTAFNTIFAPIISEQFSKNEMKKVEELFKIVTMWIFTLTLPLIPIFILFAEPIMRIFGNDFIRGSTSLIILGVGELINALVGSAGNILTMTGRAKINLFNALLFCALNIVLNYLFIPKFGINGAAIATASSIAIINFLRLIEVYFLLRIHPYKLSYLKPCIAGFLTFLLVYQLVKNISPVSITTMFLLSVLFVALYALFIFLFKLEKEDEYILKLIYQKIINFKTGIQNAE